MPDRKLSVPKNFPLVAKKFSYINGVALHNFRPSTRLKATRKILKHRSSRRHEIKSNRKLTQDSPKFSRVDRAGWVKVHRDIAPRRLTVSRWELLRLTEGNRLLLLLLSVLGRGIVAFAVGETRIGVIDRRVLAVLSVVVGFVCAGDAVAGQGRRGHVYPRTDRLEAAPGRAVLDLAHVPSVVHEAVLAVNLAGRILGLDLVRTVRSLEAVTVAAVLVMPE